MWKSFHPYEVKEKQFRSIFFWDFPGMVQWLRLCRPIQGEQVRFWSGTKIARAKRRSRQVFFKCLLAYNKRLDYISLPLNQRCDVITHFSPSPCSATGTGPSHTLRHPSTLLHRAFAHAVPTGKSAPPSVFTHSHLLREQAFWLNLKSHPPSRAPSPLPFAPSLSPDHKHTTQRCSLTMFTTSPATTQQPDMGSGGTDVDVLSELSHPEPYCGSGSRYPGAQHVDWRSE